MLDHADFIARFDKHDALGVVAGQPAQLLHEYAPVELPRRDFTSVVVAGMGGSALGAEFIKSWLGERLPVPLVIVRDYALPGFVGNDTLVVCSSYSGNTEETLSALAEAEKRGATVVVQASGGKLLEAAVAAGHAHTRLLHEGHPHLDLPHGLQPRLAVLYQVRALAGLLEAAGLAEGLVEELRSASAFVEQAGRGWQAAVPTAENDAKRIAEAVHGHAVVIYGGPTLSLPAMKWKIDFNENAKNLAFYNYLPEFNHNEFLGWGHPAPSHLKVIELRSDLDNAQVVKRFDISNKLLSDRFAAIEVHADGATKLEQMLYTLLMGDYVSVYLAFLNGIDPTPVVMIEKLKQELAKD